MKDLSGMRFGKLRVVKFCCVGRWQYFWNCICDCGNKCVIRAGALARMKHPCCRRCRIIKCPTFASHRKSNTRIYAIWSSMKTRCCNPNHAHYKDYGGRGIKVCRRWHKFENFYADMGDPPSDAHCIERIDNDAGYSFVNCRWAKQIDQQRNRRNNRLITYNRRTQCVSAWSRELGVQRDTLVRKIERGISMREIVKTAMKHQVQGKGVI